VPAQGLEIGSRLGLDAAELWILDAFVAQRRRMLERARALRDDEWTRPTRCSEWDVRELVLHVVGATDACRDTLTGEHPAFAPGFDPNADPNAFVERLADEPVTTILELLDASITTTVGGIDALRTEVPPRQVVSVWNEPIDWRLFVAHFFFDGWIHERDLLLPLGREPQVVGVEARLAAAYSFHIAAIVAGGFGIPLDTALQLGGIGGATFRIVANGLDVVISVEPCDALDSDAGPSQGDVVAVTEAIAGRGPELVSVLDAPPDVVDALSGVGAFLRG
jgi:uncharacterized protein (TIGR03083 family)